MLTNSLEPSPNSGKPINVRRLFVILLGVIFLGAIVAYGVEAIQEATARAKEDRTTQALCYAWVHRILADAKENPLEAGTYEATLDVTDSWDQPLTSILVVEELSNFARVHSNGRDMVSGSDDDHAYSKVDIHVRKSILHGVRAGAHSAGRGLTTGVIEGLGEATGASLVKAKEGAEKVKASLMGKFQKMKKEKTDGDG